MPVRHGPARLGLVVPAFVRCRHVRRARLRGPMSPPISRGFRRRRAPDADPSRLPPGQYVTRDFPVLSAGPTTHTPLEQWSLRIGGAVENERRWSWDKLLALPSDTVTRDIHCVTKWSKFDTAWKGVSVDTLLE